MHVCVCSLSSQHFYDRLLSDFVPPYGCPERLLLTDVGTPYYVMQHSVFHLSCVLYMVTFFFSEYSEIFPEFFHVFSAVQSWYFLIKILLNPFYVHVNWTFQCTFFVQIAVKYVNCGFLLFSQSLFIFKSVNHLSFPFSSTTTLDTATYKTFYLQLNVQNSNRYVYTITHSSEYICTRA